MKRNPARLVVTQITFKARYGGRIFVSEPYPANDFDAAMSALSKLRYECMEQGLSVEEDIRSVKRVDVEVAQQPPFQP
jgi:hypothetical protein